MSLFVNIVPKHYTCFTTCSKKSVNNYKKIINTYTISFYVTYSGNVSRFFLEFSMLGKLS